MAVQWIDGEHGVRFPALRVIIAPEFDQLEAGKCAQVLGLIDTGADHSVIAQNVLPPLSLRYAKFGYVHTAQGMVKEDYFHICIQLAGARLALDTQCTVGRNGTMFGPFQVIIGRDLLRHGTLVLDRDTGGSFTLDYGVIAQEQRRKP